MEMVVTLKIYIHSFIFKVGCYKTDQSLSSLSMIFFLMNLNQRKNYGKVDLRKLGTYCLLDL